MNSRRFLPALLLLFVGSGCAALIYEVVWFQLLQLVIGVSAISLGILLGTFMGGLCLGSLLFPRYITASRNPLSVYALIEIGIGAIGILVLFCMPLVSGVYTAWAGGGILGVVLRGLAAGICLLPPTMLMGATLPALARWVETTPKGVSWLGFFYAGNTCGAVIGSLLAGFYLLRVYDIYTATFVAAAINVVVAVMAMLIGRMATYTPAPAPKAKLAMVSGARSIYVATALSGLTALAAEVVWTRILSLLFGGSTYTFSLILACFLVGIGIGSAVGSSLARGTSSPRVALGWCQALLCGAMAWTAFMLTDSLPFWPVDPSMAMTPWFNFQMDMARCLWAILPGALLWGASFPLALAAAANREQDPAQFVGGLYAANTLGAIVGSLVTALFLIPWIGSQHTQQVMMVLSALSAIIVLWPLYEAAQTKQATLRIAGGLLAIAVASAALGTYFIHDVPGVLVAYGRYAARRVGQAEFIYKGEGVNASVAVSRLPNGVLNYHNAGKVQASSEPQDMRLQRMLGHFTTLVPKNPASVLVIGCGAGVTAGAVSVDPAVKRLTIAEIEPLVPRVVSTYFSQHNFDVVRNPKTHVVIDDARHFVLTTKEKFDAITSDPLDPWVKGAAMLYTKEFFELAKQHLNPGGAVTLFVQLYESNEAAVKSEVATFFSAFPNGIVWGNTLNGGGYDLVLLGQVEPTHIDVNAWEQKLQRPEYAEMAKSIRDIGFNGITDMLSTFAGRAGDLQGWLKDAAINRDRNLRLQYLAGMGLNLYESASIYSNMLVWRRYPDGLFVAPEEQKQALWQAIQTEQNRER